MLRPCRRNSKRRATVSPSISASFPATRSSPKIALADLHLAVRAAAAPCPPSLPASVPTSKRRKRCSTRPAPGSAWPPANFYPQVTLTGTGRRRDRVGLDQRRRRLRASWAHRSLSRSSTAASSKAQKRCRRRGVRPGRAATTARYVLAGFQNVADVLTALTPTRRRSASASRPPASAKNRLRRDIEAIRKPAASALLALLDAQRESPHRIARADARDRRSLFRLGGLVSGARWGWWRSSPRLAAPLTRRAIPDPRPARPPYRFHRSRARSRSTSTLGKCRRSPGRATGVTTSGYPTVVVSPRVVFVCRPPHPAF